MSLFVESNLQHSETPKEDMLSLIVHGFKGVIKEWRRLPEEFTEIIPSFKEVVLTPETTLTPSYYLPGKIAILGAVGYVLAQVTQGHADLSPLISTIEGVLK